MEAMRFSVVTEMEFDDGGEGKEKSKNRMIPGEKVSRKLLFKLATFIHFFIDGFFIL